MPNTSKATQDNEMRSVLINYRSLVSDLVEDRHDRGISTEELKAIDNKALVAIETYVLKKVQETEKAYGGCHNCYGKGYATKQDFVSGGGKKWRARPIVYCKCDRGLQLERVIAQLHELEGKG